MSLPKTFLPFLILTICLMLCLLASQSAFAQQLELVVQTGHTNSISSVAFSPDGKTLASGSADKSIKLWNVEAGNMIISLNEHKADVLAVAFSPNGKTLASGSFDNSIKLWNAETGQFIKSLNGHTSYVGAITFSLDSKTLASGSGDNSIKLWNTETGQLIKSFDGHTYGVNSVAFAPDGKTLASAGRDNSIKLWNVETGQLVKTFVGHTYFVSSVVFSPDGKTLASGSWDNSIKLWNVETGQLVKTFVGHTYVVSSVVFSPDGKILASGSWDNSIKLWNIETGKLIKSFQGDYEMIDSVAFSTDGNTLASGDRGKGVKLWNVQIGQQIKFLGRNIDDVDSVAFSPDGKTFASGSSLRTTIKLWNTETGQLFKSFDGHKYSVRVVLFSPDGKTLASVSSDTIKLWNIKTSQEIKSLDISNDLVYSVAFSPDGKIIAWGGIKTIKLSNIETGQIIKSLDGHTTAVESIAFSPDGKTLASGSLDGTMKLWDTETGQRSQSFVGHTYSVESIAFSPDGKTLASGSRDETIKLWNVKTGQQIKSIDAHTSYIYSIAFSPDGKTLASGSMDKTIKLWNVETGQLINSLESHTNSVSSVAFSLDGKFFLSGSWDGTMKLWDEEHKKPLATLILLDENDWVVIDEDGRFDATDNALKLMHYSYGLQTIDLEQFKDEYFEPGLLQKIFKGERLRAVVPLKDAKLPPEIVSQEFDVKTNKLSIKLKNRGGGFGAMKVFVNDKLAVADARDAKLKANPNTAQELVELSVDLKNGAFFSGKICEIKDGKQECRDNKITVYTSNYLAAFKKSNITSRGTEIFWLAGEDDASNFKLPTLYAIVGGVSDYTGNALDLKFAAKDAEDFSNALRFGAQRLFCDKDKPDCLDKVQITTLSTSGNKDTIAPTKENFRKAFADVAAKAQPEDIVLIYLSGHGVSLDDTDTYFYLTQDAVSPDKNDLTKNYRTVSITSNELLCWLTTTPCQEKEQQLEFEGKPQLGTKALRQVIILDTCAAGKAGQTLALIAQKDLSTDQRRAIEFLKDKSGTHILMGSTADQPSYEASKFGQGLLTRALLEGMSGAALEKVNGFVDVQTLFRYAENRVEKLAVNIGGIQRPTNAAPTGKTFAIGQMMPPAQKQIAEKLPKEKPYIIRPSFGNREDNFDNLGLNNALAKLLNDQNNPLMTKGGEAVLVYLNEENFAGAIKPTGFYTLANGIVTVKVSLYRDGQRIAEPFEVAGNEKEIVEKLLAAIRAELEKIAK